MAASEGSWGILVEKERGTTCSESPPALHLPFLWSLSAGHPFMPGGATGMSRAEQPGAAERQKYSLRARLI